MAKQPTQRELLQQLIAMSAKQTELLTSLVAAQTPVESKADTPQKPKASPRKDSKLSLAQVGRWMIDGTKYDKCCELAKGYVEKNDVEYHVFARKTTKGREDWQFRQTRTPKGGKAWVHVGTYYVGREDIVLTTHGEEALAASA